VYILLDMEVCILEGELVVLSILQYMEVLCISIMYPYYFTWRCVCWRVVVLSGIMCPIGVIGGRKAIHVHIYHLCCIHYYVDLFRWSDPRYCSFAFVFWYICEQKALHWSDVAYKLICEKLPVL
jgi:hypothetical protein